MIRPARSWAMAALLRGASLGCAGHRRREQATEGVDDLAVEVAVGGRASGRAEGAASGAGGGVVWVGTVVCMGFGARELNNCERLCYSSRLR
jgi:hypothetical protein